jgi:hypothetical protein
MGHLTSNEQEYGMEKIAEEFLKEPCRHFLTRKRETALLFSQNSLQPGRDSTQVLAKY